ncbi:unnamed protein product [Phaedon cochleariae]|uniref:Suppressor of cytokine signaling 5 n=1 Tax=Phaedon cochleariae TaxID=80249 RepID=A0A9N9SF96_PHACE|nr:unnamed protein product [Phaedon cochleariae]
MHGIMRCKLTAFFDALTDGLSRTMAHPTANASCSCDDRENQTTPSVPSTSSVPSKGRRRSLNLFGLCRERPSPFGSKRNKRCLRSSSPGKRGGRWGVKFGCSKKDNRTQDPPNCCRCTCYSRPNDPPGTTREQRVAASAAPSVPPPSFEEDREGEEAEEEGRQVEEGAGGGEEDGGGSEGEVNGVRGIYGTAPATSSLPNIVVNAPFLDMQWMRTQQHEDCEEAARLARAREIEQGVEAPAHFRPVRRVQLLCPAEEGGDAHAPRRLQLVCPPDLSVESIRALFQNHVTLRSCPSDTIPGCHTQVDFIHCLVPDLLTITNCSFYWGKMDRYEAERLLDGKPEGTFLLRDSAQEEFLFSVSFRKYGRSLHARIEQWNHKFSFDSHDPGVYTSDTVYGLIEHYKDPSSCMFFEPLLTWPLHRKFVFPLQHLARAVIAGRSTYDNINHLQLPKTLKTYLKEYHYRQKVRVERFEDDVQLFELRNVPT